MLKWSEGRTCKDENKTHMHWFQIEKILCAKNDVASSSWSCNYSPKWSVGPACMLGNEIISISLRANCLNMTSPGLKQILIVCNSFKQGTSGNVGHSVCLALVANHLAEKSNPWSWTSWTTQGEIFTLRHIRPVLQMFKRKRFKQNLIAHYRKKWRATRVWICVLLESQLKYQTM